MKASRSCTLVLALFLAGLPKAGWAAQFTCNDVQTRGRLNVLTINLLFSEVADRNARLARIADEVARLATEEANPVDVILLQEVVGGALVGTVNSSLDLQRLLAARWQFYNLRYSFADGIPFFLSVGNSILSRCPIDLSVAQFLPVVTEEPFPNISFSIPLPRKVLMTRLSVPGLGKLNVYNTHLCAFCNPVTERLKQAAVLLQFVNTVEGFFPGDGPVVLGGDFNTDLNLTGDQFVYGAIASQGFVDSYRTAHSCVSCCNPTEGFAGCTYAVDTNPYASNPPFTGGPKARIDYIFLRKGQTNVSVSDSTVIFPPPEETFVSDHSGVLTGIHLN